MIGFIRETRGDAAHTRAGNIIAAFFNGHIQPISAKLAAQEPIHHGALRGCCVVPTRARRALRQVGRKYLMNTNSFYNIDKNKVIETVDSLVSAIDDFSATRTGALIAIERETMLNDNRNWSCGRR